MFQSINIGSSVARRPSGLVGNDICRRIPSVHAADIGGTRSIRAHRKDRMRRHNRFGIHLLLAAVLASLSGIATATSDPNEPRYRLNLGTNHQWFASETFNGELSRFTRIQPSHPGAMQVEMRIVRGSIGGFNFWTRANRRPIPMRANINYCLTDGAVFGRALRDGGTAARKRNDGDIVIHDGREFEVMRFGDFEFFNADRDEDNIDLRLVFGGGEGDECATLQVVINSSDSFFTWTIHSIELDDRIVFNIPSIKNAQVLGEPKGRIGMVVDMRGITTNDFYSGLSQQKSGQYFYDDYGFGHTKIPIANSAPALQLDLRGQGSHVIRSYDARAFDHPEGGEGYDSKIAPLATLTLNENDGIQYTSNGTRDFGLMDPYSNRHRLRVTVRGPFSSGDNLFLDISGDGRISGGEALFRFNDDRTVATAEFNHRGQFNDRPIYFVASDDHDINPGNYSVDAVYDFAYRSYRDVVADRITTRINGHPSALQFSQTASATVYATEVFGDGSEETLLNARGMSTTLTAQQNVGRGGHRLRFELEAPAVFGTNIRASHLTAVNSEVSVLRGGRSGGRVVEFQVDAGSGGIPEGEGFTFNIPSVRDAGVLGEVGGAIGVTASIADGNGEFSGESIFVNSTAVATSAPGFVFDLTAGDTATIAADNPAMLLGDPNVDADSDGVNDTKALMLGTLVLERSEGVQHDHDGGDMPIRTVDEVILTVQGLYLDEGDQVFIDLDGDRHVGLGEAFAAVDVDDGRYPAVTLTLAGPDADTGADGAHVYYVPAGTENLAATTYTLVADYEFGRTDGEAENYRPLVLSAESSIMDAMDDVADVDEVITPVTVGRF